MDEEIEFKDKKITVLEDILKGFDHYDECKINFSIIQLDNLLKEIEQGGDYWKLWINADNTFK